jgi:hypothetical protein
MAPLASAAVTILLLPSSRPAPDPDTTTAPSRRSPA